MNPFNSSQENKRLSVTEQKGLKSTTVTTPYNAERVKSVPLQLLDKFTLLEQ